MSDLGLCQARIHKIRGDGTDRCNREARHEHYAFTSGARLRLCSQHLHSLQRRERLGSSADLLDKWNQRVVL